MSLGKLIYLFLLIIFFSSCKEELRPVILKTGFWRGHIEIQGQDLPFNFEIIKKDDKFQINLINGDENLVIDEVFLVKNTLTFNLHIFDIEVNAQVKQDSLVGIYKKNYADDYELPFYAVYGQKGRFDDVSASENFDGRWETYFRNGDKTNFGIGVFQSKDSVLTGTFLTATGDYRFLEGYTNLDTMYLYSFDGNHLYKFRGVKENDTLMNGEFWSGKTAYSTFQSIKNDTIELPDAHSLTYLKPGYDKIEFSFKDLNGEMVSLNDAKYKDKVVIVQILGTWCPNCMDETRFLADWYKKNRDRGVEIIGLAYEMKREFEYAKSRVQTMKSKMDVDYTVLIAGVSNTTSASESLPMLNHVMSFPTSIVIDKKGNVRRIHTGFSGPATGKYYTRFVENFNLLMDDLLAENP